MKKILIAAIGCALLFYSACTELVSPDDEDSNVLPPGGFEVEIDRLTLNANDLSTIPGRNPSLSVTITPPFATKNQLNWKSSNTDAATVDSDTGIISVRTDDVTDPITTVIRVESVSDPSKYDTCVVTVYPEYPKSREWSFGSNPGLAGDIPLANGAVLLFGSGDGEAYASGTEGPGVYVIDPENPYEHGLTPNGNPRAAGSHNTGTLAGFKYPDPSKAFSGHLRTAAASGSGTRIMKIAALFAPFTVVVNYRTNSSGEERNADIRIGDKEGWRIEGEGSLGSGSTPGKTVWYSYEADQQAGKDDFVPVVYIEGKGGLQLYAVYVLEGAYELADGKLQKKQ